MDSKHETYVGPLFVYCWPTDYDVGPKVNMRRWTNVGLLLAHRLRRWPNSKPMLGQRLMFAGLDMSSQSFSPSVQTLVRRHRYGDMTAAQPLWLTGQLGPASNQNWLEVGLPSRVCCQDHLQGGSAALNGARRIAADSDRYQGTHERCPCTTSECLNAARGRSERTSKVGLAWFPCKLSPLRVHT